MSETILGPEEYGRLHQKAFREAFDFLNSHFPPGEDPAWWEQAATDFQMASMAQGENYLVNGLLIGVYDYLEHEWKLRRKEHGATETAED